MTVHIAAVHQGVKPYACAQPGCEFRSAIRVNLLVHQRAVRSVVFRPFEHWHFAALTFVCVCVPFISFRLMPCFSRRQVHEKLRPYICKQCEFTTGEQGNLDRHMKAKHPIVAAAASS
jgi:hypothetical protein